ncbi:hypothetical protein SEUCBS140593_003476 [Sporothrix eucalyptigena]|uniref:Major facilitator superfamily (MFS) profile domain-containing protein n=1 Tax=Sporothrix eucalyptigena TaxID=1812306 RepID=A0ABP0BF54_9PEZI
MKNKSPVVTVKERTSKSQGTLAQHASERTPLLGDPTQDPNSGSAVVDREHVDDEDSEDTEAGDRNDNLANGNKNDKTKPAGFVGILALLLIGVFAANADTSLVLATYGTISSEFQSLGSASWLLTAYMLAMCGSQPLYGKLSNLYGRKTLLLVAYVLFAAGCLLCGVARSMPVVILGRLISGCGGSGMTSVVSFLIADMVPKREVASYRSYVNIVTTVGRSCGGPLGGWLAETIGWRWSFLFQVPVTVLAIALVGWRLKVPPVIFSAENSGNNNEEDTSSRLRRIDFLGATVMCATIVTLLLPLSIGGSSLPWTHPLLLSLFAASNILAVLFCYIELRVAREPIFPLPLLARRDVILPYLILFLQNIAQTLMMYGVPLYFQVTQAASPSAAGLYLVPAVVGNTIGGLLTGAYIQRAARYKLPTIVGTQVAALCHLLTSLRWTGNTAWPEALYIFPGGLGTGIIHASTFMAITASTSEEELAIAGGGLFLSGNFGSLLGVTLASSVIHAVTSAVANQKLPGRPDVVANALADVEYIQSLTGKLREAIVDAYVAGFRSNFGLACVACGISLVLSLMIRERRF